MQYSLSPYSSAFRAGVLISFQYFLLFFFTKNVPRKQKKNAPLKKLLCCGVFQQERTTENALFHPES